MKIRLLFVTVFIFCLSGIVSAQQEDLEFRQEFDAWKESVSKNPADSKDQLFFMAKAKRDDAKSATVKINLFGVLNNYEIFVRPLKYEKNADGKLVQTQMFDEVKMSTRTPESRISDRPELHSPTIAFFADSEANAVEVELKTSDNRNPKITIFLKQNEDTVGTIMSAK